MLGGGEMQKILMPATAHMYPPVALELHTKTVLTLEIIHIIVYLGRHEQMRLDEPYKKSPS